MEKNNHSTPSTVVDEPETLPMAAAALGALQSEAPVGEALADNALSEEDEDEEGEGGLYEHFRVVADKGQQLLRVDKFLLDHLPDTSRNRIQMAARAGFIHVNDQPVKSNYRVKPHDVVTLLLDRPRYEN